MNKLFGLIGLASVGLMTSANAALTIAPLATTDFETIATAVVVATGVFFGIRKAMGLLR